MLKRTVGLSCLGIIVLCLLTVKVHAAPLDLDLNLFTSGLDQPVDIANSGSVGDDRLFALEKEGRIRIVQSNGSLVAQPFLNISSKVASTGEQGLLGIAFHPDYQNNQYFFVFYNNLAGDLVVARYTRDIANANIADPSSEMKLLTIPHPTNTNHNGGDLNFDQLGYLNISTGDGGGAGGYDPSNNAQNLDVLLGKILRIDVDGDDFPADDAKNYAIPPSNPFASVTGRDEIWAYGLRNPFRFSFDRANGDMFIGDVGQATREEVDYQPASSTGGENYGWRCREGNIATQRDLSGCAGFSGSVHPVATYHTHEADGCAVTGGYVYRGSDSPALTGYYLFADYCNGSVYSLNNMGTSWEKVLQYRNDGIFISTFGEDVNGELYAADVASGSVYRLAAKNITQAPLYRLYKGSPAFDHYYTPSSSERDEAESIGYDYSVICCNLSRGSASSFAKFYELYSAKRKDHFYTLSLSERTKFISNGYESKGIAGYISPAPPHGFTSKPANGLVPLYRLYSAVKTNHFYTVSKSHRDQAIVNGYVSQGIAGYVFPSH